MWDASDAKSALDSGGFPTTSDLDRAEFDNKGCLRTTGGDVDEVFATRASIEMANEKELYQVDQITSQVTHLITIRWPGLLVSVVPGMRILFGSHVYSVQAVNNVSERNRVVQPFALEINGAD